MLLEPDRARSACTWLSVDPLARVGDGFGDDRGAQLDQTHHHAFSLSATTFARSEEVPFAAAASFPLNACTHCALLRRSAYHLRTSTAKEAITPKKSLMP